MTPRTSRGRFSQAGDRSSPTTRIGGAETTIARALSPRRHRVASRLQLVESEESATSPTLERPVAGHGISVVVPPGCGPRTTSADRQDSSGPAALPGCGPLSAAKLLGEIGPIDRFDTDAQLARHAGVAPLEASSGKHQRHRLDRGGNRQLNCALHRIAITQARVHPPARAYLERKQAEGKSRREAIRCLKRQLARTVYNTLKAIPALT